MDLAHAKAVRHHWLSVRLAVSDDVRRIKKFAVLDPANCASTAIRQQHLGTEYRLVEPTLGQPFDVAPGIFAHRLTGRNKPLGLVQGQDELEFRRLLTHDPYGIDRLVQRWRDPHKPNDRHLE